MYLLKNKDLIIQLLKRDILVRYKGSALGIIWSIINPLIMLVIYTFVFSVIFQAKWGSSVSTNQAEYALLLFVGLVFYNIFSEVVSRSPGLILGNQNYVTKVIFPLEVLSIVTLLNAIIHSLISLAILVIGILLYTGELHVTLLLLPLIYLPLGLFSLGISWLLSSLGVFVRDISYFVGITVQILFFVTPIFYPISALPEDFQPFMQMNPLTGIIENAREIIFYGNTPNLEWLMSSLALSIITMVVGYVWFIKTKKAFADVL